MASGWGWKLYVFACVLCWSHSSGSELNRQQSGYLDTSALIRLDGAVVPQQILGQYGLSDRECREFALKQRHPPRYRGGRTTKQPSKQLPVENWQDAQRLGQRFLADTVAAVVSSFCVSPFISIVDRSIIQKAAGAMGLRESVHQGFSRLLTNPGQFVRSPDFLWVWGLYAATYTTANFVSTLTEEARVSPAWPKFLATTAVNLPTCVAKDRAFARMFGVIAPGQLPFWSYALFTLRDSATIAASFNLPAKVSAQAQEWGLTQGWADTVAQLLCPGFVQFFSTPLHLLGLDLYNRAKATPAERLSLISQGYLPSVLMRFCRIGCAFGVGGVGNKMVRDRLSPPASQPAF